MLRLPIVDQEEVMAWIELGGGRWRGCLVEVVWRVRWDVGERMRVKSLPQVIWRMLCGVGMRVGWGEGFGDGPSWPFLESP